ncbi:MAG: hypothetical protein P4L51_14885 [Puia sp.]|nr:hypothetical protein [Puia sp.]
MKDYKKVIVGLLSLGMIFLSATGCVEHRYYHDHHHHSPEYYRSRHMDPPPGVDINIHN